jgi:hypothetical protein
MVRRWFIPLAIIHKFSFEEWIATTSYNERRKNHLRKIKEKNLRIRQKNIKVKAHVKQEFYDYFNRPRGIYSRADVAKVMLGPICKSIEEIVYKSGHFVKHVDVDKRAGFIKEKMARTGVVFNVSDYTAFEATQSSELMDVCEFELYRYMLGYHPKELALLNMIKGKNRIEFGDILCEIKGCRMSGEMNTSLGNGFTNLMVLLYIAHLKGEDISPVVEGDDSIFSSSLDFDITPGDFTQFGLIAKLERHQFFSESSFCGIRADPDAMENITDIVSCLNKLPWTYSNKKFANKIKRLGLLKCKVASIAFQFPSCPILWAYCKRMFVLLEKVQIVVPELDWWTHKKFIAAGFGTAKFLDNVKLCKPPSPETRLIVSKMYGIEVGEQLEVEEWLLSKMTLNDEIIRSGPFSRFMLNHVHRDCITNWYENVVQYKAGTAWAVVQG